MANLSWPRADQTASLADVIAAIEGLAETPKTRRRQLLSDVRTFARWQGSSPDRLPASVGFIRRSFADLTPAGCGVSPRRFANVKSAVRRALDLTGLREADRYRGVALSPAWQALYDRLPDKYHRTAIRPFIRFATVQDIDPDEVDEAVSHGYLAWLEANSFKNPAGDHQTFVRLWNRAVENIAGWPTVQLIKPPRRQTYGVRWNDLPAPFLAEAEAYFDSLRTVDLFALSGPVKPPRESSIRSAREQLRIAASALLRSGLPVERLTGLAELVRLENFKAILRFHLDRADGAVKRWHFGLARQLLCIARHWLQLPEGELEALSAICSRLGAKCPSPGMIDKNRERLRPLEDADNLERLIVLPVQEAIQAQRARPQNRTTALRLQVAIGLDLLLRTSLRIGNLAGLRLDRNLHWSRGPGRGVLHIAVPAEHVKNAEALDYEIEAGSAKLIRVYCERYLPRLADGPPVYLFPGRDDRSKDPGTLGKQINRLIRRRLGFKVNPHLFRHINSHQFLKEIPGAYELVARHLGHRSRETAYRYYSRIEAAQAHQVLDDLVTGIRRNHQPRRRPKGNRSAGSDQ